jgi:hypothetical protein
MTANDKRFLRLVENRRRRAQKRRSRIIGDWVIGDWAIGISRDTRCISYHPSPSEAFPIAQSPIAQSPILKSSPVISFGFSISRIPIIVGATSRSGATLLSASSRETHHSPE